MSEKMLIRHCSPTLAGLKTGNMFSCFYASKQDMIQSLREFNRRLSPTGLRVIPIQYRAHRALIYVYRPAHLARDLSKHAAKEILGACGYSCTTPWRCVSGLIDRLKESEEFPHEIGLFLGYPPEDVHGFIENKSNTCKCVGTWKVYGNEAEARMTFEKYKKCTDVYTGQWERGKSIEKLTVKG